jgi:hypothetical protein
MPTSLQHQRAVRERREPPDYRPKPNIEALQGRELLDQVLIVDERQLRKVLAE